MIALGHFDPNTGELLGVWMPPKDEKGKPTPYYPNAGAAEELAQESVDNKGTDPTWEDWFDQLSESLPYDINFVEAHVDPDITPEALFGYMTGIAAKP